MTLEEEFDPNQTEGTELKPEDSPKTVEEEKSLPQLQREYASAWLDYSIADLAQKRANRKEIDHHWLVIDHPDDVELKKENDILIEELAEAERKLEEAAQRQAAAFDALDQACPDGQHRKIYDQALEHFALIELEHRVDQDPEKTIASWAGNPSMQDKLREMSRQLKNTKEILKRMPSDDKKVN